MKKLSHKSIFAAVIFGFCLEILIISLFKPDTVFSQMENRYLAAFPYLDVESVLDGSFSKDVETYINEQFPFRNIWIQAKSLMETFSGKKENNGIIRGKEDYLFPKVLSAGEQLEKNENAIEGFVKNTQANVTVSIIPNSYSVLNDKLPKGTPNYDQKEETIRFQNQLNGIKGDSTLNAIDILENRKDEYIYYRTDHHWTTLGAYYTYEAYCKKNGMNPVSLNSISANEIKDFKGTYYAKYKGIYTNSDTITYYDAPITGMQIDDREMSTLYDLEKIKVYDKYAMFLYGNNGLSVIRTDALQAQENTGISKKLLVLKDSYANSFIPFLTYNYDEIYVVDLRYYAKSISALINENGIEDVLLLYNFDSLMTGKHFYRLVEQQGMSDMSALSEKAGEAVAAISGNQPVGAGENTVSSNNISDNPDAAAGTDMQPTPTPPDVPAAALPFQVVEESYFDDAVFIGDSRVEGFGLHSGLNSSFYAERGLHLAELTEKKFIKENGEELSIPEALTRHVFGKVYIMLGINELGWGTDEQYVEKYREFINTVKLLQPGAIIYIQGSLHVTAAREIKDPLHNNVDLERRNQLVKLMAAQEGCIYLDVNEVFTDPNGYLFPECTTDGIHLKAYYMDLWKLYLRAHGIVKQQ